MHTILYLSYTGMTDPLGQSQVLAYLKGLQQTGRFRFVLVSFEKPAAYKQFKNPIASLCNEAGIIWHPLPYTAKPPVVSTYKDVRNMRRMAESLVKQYRFSIVHCRSYIPSLIGLYLKKKHGIPFLFDMRGFWADERLDGGIWKLSNPLYALIYKYFKKKEKAFLLNAGHIVSLTQNAKNEILSWKLSTAPLPVTVIPCCVDLKLFNPAAVSAAQQKEALQALDIPAGATIISYVGSLGTWYMLPQMMAFIKTCSDVLPGLYFMVLTGEPEDMVQKAAGEAGFDVSYLRIKKVPRHQMPLYISLSTASVFFIKPAFSKKASSPVKQGELMAMGIPVICNDAVGDTSEIVLQYKAGVIVREFATDAYLNAMQDFQHAVFDTAQIKKGAADYYALDRGVQLYASVYETMAHEQA